VRADKKNVSPVSLPKVSSEYRVGHAASKGCGTAGRQQRVQELGLGGQVLDLLILRNEWLFGTANFKSSLNAALIPCARRGGSQGVAGSRGVVAVVGRRNKGQLQEQRIM
jgi:hypothetical protein